MSGPSVYSVVRVLVMHALGVLFFGASFFLVAADGMVFYVALLLLPAGLEVFLLVGCFDGGVFARETAFLLVVRLEVVLCAAVGWFRRRNASRFPRLRSAAVTGDGRNDER
jgi:hypothetical protein